MPRHKTSKKKTHKRRRRGGGLMDYLPSWLGGPSDTISGPAPAPSLAPPSPTPTFSPPAALGGKSRRRRKH